MKEIHYHTENICSIGQIENTFSGRYILRDILNRILRITYLVIANIQRPFYEVQSSVKAISEISSEIENLSVDERWFSISFNYYTKEQNESFINTFLEIWFEYEQPGFSFFVTSQESNDYKRLKVHRRMDWKEITVLSPCYVMFRSCEEDVLWIGKSGNLEFNEVIV